MGCGGVGRSRDRRAVAGRRAGSPDFSKLNAICWNEQKHAHQLLDTLAQSVAAYIIAQAASGSQAQMKFETSRGLLGHAPFRELSLR